MKLEMSLPERPGLLHAVPVMDLFVLLWLLFLISSALVRQSGLTVELPPSKFQLERYQSSIVITLAPRDDQTRIHYGREMVSMAELKQRLEHLAEDGGQADSVVLLQSDADTPVGLEREISEMVLNRGFRLAIVGASQSPSVDSKAPE